MISYHPDSRFLTDFASANLPLSEAVCVSAHLEFCGKCRAHVQQLTDIGAHLFARLSPQALEEDGFERLMGRIADQESTGSVVNESESGPQTDCSAVPGLSVNTSAEHSVRTGGGVLLPRALRRLAEGGVQNLRWVQLGKALRIAPLHIDDSVRETAIYDIKAGGRMPEHEHRGEEITVLLRGSFSDAEGSYSRGDFVVRNAGEAHQPTATQDMDCLCLVSLERPVRPRSWFYRLLEPFVQHQLQKAATR
ncbi:MAG: cupin domain-containing protein [Pseudomonadota bacterium]